MPEISGMGPPGEGFAGRGRLTSSLAVC